MKKCPYCAEEIQDEAIVCRHCGRNIAGGIVGLPAGPPPTGASPMAPQTNGMAIAALIFGLLPLFGIGVILAIVFGNKAKREIDESGGAQTGRGMAVAGIVLGWIWFAVFVVGVLVAIALPTFLGARTRAEDKAAQSTARNAIAAAKTLFTDSDDYSGISPESMASIEPSLSYTTGPSAGRSEVSLATSGYPYMEVGIAVLSDSGDCFLLHDDAQVGTFYGVGSANSCTGDSALSASGANW